MARLLRRHWLLALLVLGGATLRVITQLAYQPALLYIDSFRYLEDLGVFYPGGINPIGYEVLMLGPLMLLAPFAGDFAFVVGAQHLIGILLGVAIYVLLRRLGVRNWLAALACAPVLLDAYQVQIEHMIMSDLLFQVLLLGAVALLTWWGPPGPKVAALAGLVLGLSVLVRLVGLTLIVPAVVFVLVAAGMRPKGGWLRRIGTAAALTAAFLAVVVGYGFYTLSTTGNFALSGTTGSVVYGRTAVVADCAALDLTPEEEIVCPDEPVEERQERGIDFYIHVFAYPGVLESLPEGFDYAAAQSSFAKKVVLNQPGDVVSGVVRDFLKGFAPTRTQSPGDVPLDRWQFQLQYPFHDIPEWYVMEYLERYDDGELYVDVELASWLRSYQLSYGYTPGTVLGVLLLASVAAMLGVGRARRSGLRAACLLPAGLATTVLSTAAAMEFSWRYQLPALVLLPIAGALGLTAIFGRRPDDAGGESAEASSVTPTGRPARAAPKESDMTATFPDEVDRTALDDYAERYGDQGFAPVVVLIAAYNEEAAIADVLDGMPSTSCGLDVDTLVVVDGASDDTADVAKQHNAYTCVVPTNRGQGAALRLGYRLAGERGAKYVVTTDADGQYDIAELPSLLQPLIDDEADFVTGSRRLGRSETTDGLRKAGTYVFAWVVSALTGQTVTDTSFGFRGMKVEVANTVRLEQNQYQSSELLVGVLAHGYRVLEKPMTMLERSAGESKKGNNILYGYRYTKVVLGTLWRERREESRRAQDRVDDNVSAATAGSTGHH
ncbi:glycosyltransferase [Allosaccharopolyspora coralli]|uniref:Glycosyltransferase n=1 Tax=Allosaccharopolyspora coralli TaxID=2665642 RepID=A0A5Q3Q7Y9_9PSEU|nr:glycosyltransferase [Allosaccharopolyspora coralli]QGK70791.1 glycosyltransferase [Allosaccharopolyspora coralli]